MTDIWVFIINCSILSELITSNVCTIQLLKLSESNKTFYVLIFQVSCLIKPSTLISFNNVCTTISIQVKLCLNGWETCVINCQALILNISFKNRDSSNGFKIPSYLFHIELRLFLYYGVMFYFLTKIPVEQTLLSALFLIFVLFVQWSG